MQQMLNKHSLLLLIVFGIVTASAHTCHNSTGACHHNGKYECADGSTVPWSKRCDDVEDCADGADEFLCPHRMGKGEAADMHELMNCGPTCACAGATVVVASTSPFFQQALYAPVWDGGAAGNLMTGTPVNGLWGCNTAAGKTVSVTMIWYRKGSVNCVGNTRRGGFICCGRAIKCTCGGGGTGNRCA
jgi:hypothetical protein